MTKNLSVVDPPTQYDDLPELLRVEEAAEALRVKRWTVRQLIAAGTLPVVRFGKRIIRIRRDDLPRVVAKLTEGGE